MKFNRYRFMHICFVIIVIMLFSAQIYLKINLNKLKIDANAENVKKTHGREGKKSTDLYDIIKLVEDNKAFQIEEINLKEEGKEVILQCNKDIDTVRKILNELKEVNIIQDITKIDYNENQWSIMVLFH